MLRRDRIANLLQSIISVVSHKSGYYYGVQLLVSLDASRRVVANRGLIQVRNACPSYVARTVFTAINTSSSSLCMRHKYPSSSLSELSRSLNAARPCPPFASPRIRTFRSPVIPGRQFRTEAQKDGACGVVTYLRMAAGPREGPQGPAGDRGLAAAARPCQWSHRTILVLRS